MNAKTLRTLSATGAVAALLIGASPAWAQYEYYGHHYGYGPRYVHPYRPAVVVVPPWFAIGTLRLPCTTFRHRHMYLRYLRQRTTPRHPYTYLRLPTMDRAR